MRVFRVPQPMSIRHRNPQTKSFRHSLIQPCPPFFPRDPIPGRFLRIHHLSVMRVGESKTNGVPGHHRRDDPDESGPFLVISLETFMKRIRS
ncbi:MAG: hypothetical protein ACKO23_03715, partial [Gemmataceae bacterium]